MPKMQSTPLSTMSSTLDRLFDVLATEMRRGAMVAGTNAAAAVASLRERGLDDVVHVTIPDDGPCHDADGASGARRVLLLEVDHPPLGAFDPDRLRAAWERVRAGGRLLVCSPNPDAYRDGRDNLPTRRELKRALRTLGRAKVLTDQPYAWLLLSVEKSRDGEAAVPRSRLRRYDVIAGLCRGEVVELGCGAGELASAIHQRGHPVTGVDLSEAKIERARRRCPSAVFLVDDILTLGLPAGSFDTAVISEVLEHVAPRDGVRMLDAARRLVRRGGRLVVSVPNGSFVPHPNHVRLFERRDLARMLRPYGRPRLVVEQPFKWLLMHVDVDP